MVDTGNGSYCLVVRHFPQMSHDSITGEAPTWLCYNICWPGRIPVQVEKFTDDAVELLGSREGWKLDCCWYLIKPPEIIQPAWWPKRGINQLINALAKRVGSPCHSSCLWMVAMDTYVQPLSLPVLHHEQVLSSKHLSVDRRQHSVASTTICDSSIHWRWSVASTQCAGESCAA